MKITGELLKSERVRKNLSVQDVAFALKLSQKIILAIESGQTENLPAKTFIRGFVKSYAQFLKMDTDEVMRQFQEEMGSTHPQQKNLPLQAKENEPSLKNKVDPESKKEKGHDQNAVLTRSKNNHPILYIGVAVVLVILIVTVNRLVDRYQKESVLNPQDISKVQPLDPNQTQAPQNNLNPQAQVAPAASHIISTDSSASTTKTNPLSSAYPAATTTPPTQAVAPTADTTSSLDVEDGFEPSSGKPVEIIIEAKKDTEVMYARGNTKTFSKLKLISKQIQVIRSTTGLHLKANDGGSIGLIVNGIDKGLAGANNKPLKLSF